MINLGKRKGVMHPDNPTLVSTAEAATLQLEFRYLSWLTDNEEYWEKAEKVRRLRAVAETLGLMTCAGNESNQRCTISYRPCFYLHEVCKFARSLIFTRGLIASD